MNTDFRTILYYPRLYPRQDLWIRACALHFDGIATIAPCRAVREKLPASLHIFKENGIYEAIDPCQLFGDKLLYGAFLKDLNRDMRKRRIISKQYYTHRKERFDAACKTPAALKKLWIPFEKDELPPDLTELLLSAGILMEHENGTRWMSDEEMATQIYYGIMARYLAYLNDNYMIMGTDELTYHVYPFGEAQDPLADSRILYINILMQRVLPVPIKSTPLADILAFRKTYRKEIDTLDWLLNSYIKRISRCRDVGKLQETTYKYQEELEFALDNFLYYMDKGGMRYEMHSMKQTTPIGIHPAMEHSRLRGMDAPVLVTSATRETELIVQLKAQINKEAPWCGLERERAVYLYDSRQSLVTMRE